LFAFRGDTSAVIFHAIIERAPAAPSRINPDIPPKLEEIISKGLDKDPELRYQNAADMRADLKRVRREMGIRAKSGSREWRGYHAVSLIKRIGNSASGTKRVGYSGPRIQWQRCRCIGIDISIRNFASGSGRFRVSDCAGRCVARRPG
jgi:serine/threonine protein kinase